MRRVCYLLVVVSLLLTGSLAFAQHLGSRQQWQPQTETDPRLQQPVQLEIIGRAALTGLPLLSDKTGVTLTVAPEDLATVGERKFTVIAQGCTLKAILVQLCQALQECHWDVDTGGKELVYLLHRNGSLEETVETQIAAARETQADARRVRLFARMEEARAALGMNDEQLREVARTDPVLALTMRNPDARNAVEAFLSLPKSQLQQFLDHGELEMRYADAPPVVQQAAVWGMSVRLAEQRWARVKRRPDDGGNLDGMLQYEQSMASKLQRMSGMALLYHECLGWSGSGVRMTVCPANGVPRADAPSSDYVKLPVLPPRHPISRYEHLPLLVEPGKLPGETEMKMVEALEEEGMRLYRAEEQRRAAEALPDSAALRQVMPFHQDSLPLEQFQAAVARETGWSIISDHFTEEHRWYNDPEREETIGDGMRFFGRRGRGLSWQQVGQCLVCHHRDWHERATAEIPERVLAACRHKLELNGHLTLDDLFAVATALQARPAPRYQPSIPDDLQGTGFESAAIPHTRWAILLHGLLSPAQAPAAASEMGLSYRDMTAPQRELAGKALRHDPPFVFEGGPINLPPEAMDQAVFRMRWTATNTKDERVEFRLDLDSGGESASVTLGRRASGP